MIEFILAILAALSLHNPSHKSETEKSLEDLKTVLGDECNVHEGNIHQASSFPNIWEGDHDDKGR